MSSTLAASSSSSTSSPRCVPFAFRRGGGRGRLRQAPAAAAACGGCGRPLCCPAEVIQNAFFVSLDVCACVKVRTDSFRESESENAPLMSSPSTSSPAPLPHDAARGGGRRRASSTGGKPRRGLGCCTPSSTSVN